MKKQWLNQLKLLLLLSFAVTASLSLHAAEDSTEIELSYTYVEYLNFIGSAAGATRYFGHDEVMPLSNKGNPANRIGQTVNLGTLGLNSNITGDCTLDFSTQNDFQLEHTTSGKVLTSYRLEYRNTEITSGSNLQILLPCSSPVSNIDFTTTGKYQNSNKPKAGVYQDIVNITVTSQ